MDIIERRTTPIRNRNFHNKRTYAAFIYKRFDMSCNGNSVYDVEIILNNHKIEPRRAHDRKCVYGLIVTSHRNILMSQLIKYMEVKFSYAQYGGPIAPEIKERSAKFSQLAKSLEWIKSIISVEFDYHVGERLCRAPDNKLYLDDYISSRFNGYGPSFYKENTYVDVDPELFGKLFG